MTLSYTELNWWLLTLYLASGSRRLRSLVHVNSASILVVSTVMLWRHRHAMARRHHLSLPAMWVGHAAVHGLPLLVCPRPRGPGARGALCRSSMRAVALQAAWWMNSDPNSVYVPVARREWLISWAVTILFHLGLCKCKPYHRK